MAGMLSIQGVAPQQSLPPFRWEPCSNLPDAVPADQNQPRPEALLDEALVTMTRAGLGAIVDALNRRWQGGSASCGATPGTDALERFVRREPLRRVHECCFAVLALASEPIDPRL